MPSPRTAAPAAPVARLLLGAFLAFILLLGLAPVAQALTAPSGGTQLLGSTDLSIGGYFAQGSYSGQPVASRTIVDIADMPFTKAGRINASNPNGQFWSSYAAASSTIAVAQDDVLLVHLWMRCISTTDETGSAFFTVYVQGPSPSYTKSVSQEVRAGSEWVEYFIPFTAVAGYSAGQFSANLGFGAGSRPQVFEVGGFEILWYGKSRTLAEMPRTSFQYEGRDANASWRTAANARIEQIRKANYEVRVLDAGGMPVKDATVRVKLKRHAFPFGVAFESRFMFQAFTGNILNQTYIDKITDLFNSGSTGNDLKWGPWVGEWGNSYGKPVAIPALTHFKNKGFLLRGHVLVWPSFRNLPNLMQTPLTNTDPGVPKMITDHIDAEVGEAKQYVQDWDVLNEPYDNHDVMDRYGDAVMVDWFKHARAAHPEADLYINEYGIISGGGTNSVKQQFYEDKVRYLLNNGAPVTGMGFQGHFDGAPTGITKALSVIDRYATAFPNMKFKITEFDVVTDDEALQADYTRDFLTACFSHPRINGFQFWGIWENDHWRKSAALYKADWTEKPNGTAYRTLVKQTWHTDQTRTSADDGRVAGRGFKGLYDVEVSVGGKTYTSTLTIDDDGVAATVTVDGSAAAAPVFTRQPFGKSVSPGESVTFSCEVVGNPAPTLAWYKDDVLLPQTTQTLSIASAVAGDSGTYQVRATNAHGTTISRDFKLAVLVPAERTSRLINISTRGPVLTGWSTLTPGFVVKGAGSPKKFLLRAVGPRLADFGLPPATDPALLLNKVNVSGALATNDDWSAPLASLFDEVGAFSLTNPNTQVTDLKSAALTADLGDGLFTADCTDNNTAGGIGIAEVYDTAPDDTTMQLVNISTRGYVGLDHANLVAGFVIKGNAPLQVLIRGVGRTLGGFGVPDVVQDPQIVLNEILPGGTPRLIASNDDWNLADNPTAIEAARESTGAFAIPSYSTDACILTWLEPGNYTITMSGVGRTTGNAIVEVYAVAP